MQKSTKPLHLHFKKYRTTLINKEQAKLLAVMQKLDWQVFLVFI